MTRLDSTMFCVCAGLIGHTLYVAANAVLIVWRMI